MILPIYAYGHPVLRKETKDIEADYPNLKKLIEDMYETMYHAKGMGLAAPQIGKDIRLFIVDTLQLDDDDMDNGERGIRQVFINADIIEEGGKEWPYEEGCLSIPDVRGKVKRLSQVRIEYYDENFVLQDKVFTGMTARVIQHEYDHVDGILFTDLLKPLKKRMIKKRMEMIRKGKINPSYHMIFV